MGMAQLGKEDIRNKNSWQLALKRNYCVCIAEFSACGCQKKSVEHKTECRHVAVKRGKQDQNHLQA